MDIRCGPCFSTHNWLDMENKLNAYEEYIWVMVNAIKDMDSSEGFSMLYDHMKRFGNDAFKAGRFVPDEYDTWFKSLSDESNSEK